jgi:hypothetical protein
MRSRFEPNKPGFFGLGCFWRHSQFFRHVPLPRGRHSHRRPDRPLRAGIADAAPTLTNQETAVVLTAGKSDSGGNFSFQAVPAPGAYSLTVDVAGFGRFEQKDIVVTAGERRSLGTIALTIGVTRQTVTVEATATPVQTGSAERSADLDKHEIEALLARGLN